MDAKTLVIAYGMSITIGIAFYLPLALIISVFVAYFKKQPLKIHLKKALILGTVLGAGQGIVIIEKDIAKHASRVKVHNATTDPEHLNRVEATLLEAAKSINKKAPVSISSNLRLDKAVAGPGAQLTYFITLLTKSSKDVNANIKNQSIIDIKKSVCEDEAKKQMLESGSRYLYVFTGNDAVEIVRFGIENADCK